MAKINILNRLCVALEWFIKALLIVVLGLMMFGMYKFHVHSERQYKKLSNIERMLEEDEIIEIEIMEI